MHDKKLIFLLPLLLALFFFDVLFLGKTFSASSLVAGATPGGPYRYAGHRPDMPFTFDTGGNAWVNEPNPYIVRRALDRGRLPLWNPYEGLGIPLIANLNNEVFNPLKVFLNLFPGPFLQDLFFVLRLLVMGVFTYLFLAERGRSARASLLGSAFFMLSGYSVWWVNLHPLSTVMYLPAVFYFYEKWGNKRDRVSPFFMSLSLCFALVSGKIPDVIMGLALLSAYAVWKGIRTGSAKATALEAGKVVMVTISGAMMAAVALLPFLELYDNASPLARAIRTGAAGHTLPLITSATLVQPLFLGLKNYFYGSWLAWTPHIMLPYTSLVLLIFVVYAALNRRILSESLPFLLFTLTVLSIVYGVLPGAVVSKTPLFRSIEFLKYNAMCYFSIGIIAASAFDHILSVDANRRRFYLSASAVSLALIFYWFFLYRMSPPTAHDFLTVVLGVSLLGVAAMCAVFHFSKGSTTFAMLVFGLVVLELFVYMPKDRPDRSEPYREPPYAEVVNEGAPFRFTGDGSILPPLVSGAMGLYDIRGVSVLLPRDYYISFEELLSFSVPQTNNPDPLFSATSPFLDLVGVKYILSREPIEKRGLEDAVKAQVASTRWVRLFDSMISNAVRYGATYGYSTHGSERRFSFFFPAKFVYEARLRVTEPFLFAGFSLEGAPNGATAKVKITVEDRKEELSVGEGLWTDRWIDLSGYAGKVVDVCIEGDRDNTGRIALGNFGFSPGRGIEEGMYEKLLALHNGELPFMNYRGLYDGMHIYENTNVMDRAFVLRRTKPAGSLNEVIGELQDGWNFREVGLVAGTAGFKMHQGMSSSDAGGEETGKDAVTITKYAPDDVALEVRSKGGLLVLSDLYYPGWKAEVNGREEKVLRVFGFLRGVAVGEGRSVVRFLYRPAAFYAGAIVSVLTIGGWVILLLISRRGKR